ncbi:hypothetical protein DSM109990_00802 [Sulfitobacter dubius]|uniref:Uncharacterized protein n=1 Tax=Sulfitobacter dubius TaxID=218673 RepID=A0ABY3ZJR6_9RHOB|nr:hypothetical protein DSM109990_00802 [Sulfitobacter dubius]
MPGKQRRTAEVLTRLIPAKEPFQSIPAATLFYTSRDAKPQFRKTVISSSRIDKHPRHPT